jgi:hypothetical protein
MLRAAHSRSGRRPNVEYRVNVHANGATRLRGQFQLQPRTERLAPDGAAKPDGLAASQRCNEVASVRRRGSIAGALDYFLVVGIKERHHQHGHGVIDAGLVAVAAGLFLFKGQSPELVQIGIEPWRLYREVPASASAAELAAR